MTTERVEVFAGDEAARGPSLEEQYEALKQEGIITDDEDTPTKDTGLTDDRPEWLPEQFKSAEELAKAYDELRRKMSSGKAKDEPDEETQSNTDGPTEEQRVAAEKATEKAGLDLQEVSKEWAANGGLTDETYAKLEAAGYPREMVDVYIEGLTHRTTQSVTEAYNIVGGQEAYDEMIEWAINNLPEDEQNEFDKAVNSGNRYVTMAAIKSLKADFDKSKADDSQEPDEIIDARRSAPSNIYETFDDYMEDLNDPRYDSNESFRNKVIQKLARSNIM